jgi:hypothetical protein
MWMSCRKILHFLALSLWASFVLASVIWGNEASAQSGDDCRYSISFQDMPETTFLNYRETITNVIHWYLTTARDLSSGDAGELDTLFVTASEAMKRFRKQLSRSVVSRDEISRTIDSLMGEFDIVVSTASQLNTAGEKLLRHHVGMKQDSVQQKEELGKVVRAAECDLLRLRRMENSPEAGTDVRVGEWISDMRATVEDSLNNIRDIKQNLEELEQGAFETMGAVDHFIESSLKGMGQQFTASTTYVFTSFKAMQTSRQYVRMDATRVRFLTLRDITAQNIERIDRNVEMLKPKLEDMERTFLGFASSGHSGGDISWDQIVNSMRVFEEELDKLALALEGWSLNYWEKQIGKDVELTCNLVAYRYNELERRVDKSSSITLEVGQKIKIRGKREDIGGELYMIISKSGDTTNRYRSPIHTALTVVSASQFGEKCRKQE